MSKKTVITLIMRLIFPKSPKKATERNALLKKMRALIEQERESLPFKEIKFERKRIILTTKELLSIIDFTKPLSMVAVLEDPEKNIKKGNELGNKLINYINTVLGDYAKEAKVISNKTAPWKKGEVNVAKKLIGERRIAKVNEFLKKTLNPVGLIFEYSSDGRDNLIVSAQLKEEVGSFALSRYTYKNALPWDLMLCENTALTDSMKIIDRIVEVEI